MKRIVVAIPHSHTWFWTQTCLASIARNPPLADGFDTKVVVVNNSPWSPSILGITDTVLGRGVVVIPNHKSNRFHASALDCVVDRSDLDLQCDYLMALETDVLVCRPDWLQWFVDQMKETDYAVGAWHHEQFVNPSCTLYRADILRKMGVWCKIHAPQNELRWGPNFEQVAPLDPSFNLQLTGNAQLTEMKEWIAGPFAEKRGFTEGTQLKEPWSGQNKGPGWFEPGQQLHHYATNIGHTYTIVPTLTTKRADDLPLQTMYGTSMPDPERQLEAVELFGNCYAAHLWGGTRALDILKHEVTCQFVKANTPMWLAREARYWRSVVPQDVQEQTLELIQRYGWHTTGQGNNIPGGDERDRAAADFVRRCYAEGGVTW